MKSRLLIIESDEHERINLEKSFTDQYLIQFAADLFEAKVVYDEFRPQVLLADMPVPEIESFAELFRIQSNADYTIPVILTVSLNNIEVERFARENNVFYYMVNPIDYRELDEALDSAFRFSHQKKLEWQILALRQKVL